MNNLESKSDKNETNADDSNIDEESDNETSTSISQGLKLRESFSVKQNDQFVFLY